MPNSKKTLYRFKLGDTVTHSGLVGGIWTVQHIYNVNKIVCMAGAYQKVFDSSNLTLAPKELVVKIRAAKCMLP